MPPKKEEDPNKKLRQYSPPPSPPRPHSAPGNFLLLPISQIDNKVGNQQNGEEVQELPKRSVSGGELGKVAANVTAQPLLAQPLLAQPLARPNTQSAPAPAQLTINVNAETSAGSSPDGSPDPVFYTNLINANDIGLEFVDIIQHGGSASVSFVIKIHLFNAEGNLIYEIPLTLTDFLNLNIQQLSDRAAMDIRKDLTNAKIKLSANGAKEIIKKTMPGVFNDTTLNKTLDELLGDYKRGWSLETPTPSPSAGEIMTQGVLSSANHLFKLESHQLGNGGRVIYRDSGPSVSEVIESYRPPTSSQPLTPTTILEVLKGGEQRVFHNTAGNYLDPATNPNYGHLYSPKFVHFQRLFLSKFNGMENGKLKLALRTVRSAQTAFSCGVDIEHRLQMEHRDNVTKANFSNLYCNIQQKPEKGGIGSIPHQSHNPVQHQPQHTYTNINGIDVVTNNGTVKEFVHGISGNNEKNQFLLQFMNKQFTGTQKSQALAKIILKSFGDPNQLLFITGEILYYALKRLQAALQATAAEGRQPNPNDNLHYFMKDTMNKYLLITCDSVLARLAVAFRFPVALQIGRSIAYISFQQQDAYIQAKCAFISKIETLKQNMDKYVSLLAKCNGLMNTYIIYSNGNSAINSNTVWDGTTFNQNKKILCDAIREHYQKVETFGPQFPSEKQADGQPNPNYQRELDGLNQQLQPLSMLFNKPLVSKSTKSTLNGSTIYIYHLNYLQSLMILATSSTQRTHVSKFIFRTKICNTEILAYNHTDYQEGLTIAESREPGPINPDSRSDSQLSSSSSSSSSSSPSSSSSSSSPSSSEPRSESLSRTAREQITISEELKVKVASQLLMFENNKPPRPDSFIKMTTESIERNRYHLRSRGLRSQVGGSHSHKIQKGGCQESHADPYINFDGLFGEKYNIVVFDNSEYRESYVLQEVDNTIKIKLPIRFTQSPSQQQYDLLELNIMDIPFVQFWTFALLSYIVQINPNFIRTFFKYIIGSDLGVTAAIDIKFLVLYDIVSEYIVYLRIRDEETKNGEKIKFGESDSAGEDSHILALSIVQQTEKNTKEFEQPPVFNVGQTEQEIQSKINSIFQHNFVSHVDEQQNRAEYKDSIGELIAQIFSHEERKLPQLLYSLCQLMNGGLDTDADYSQLEKEPLEMSATMAAVSISISLGREYSLSQVSAGRFSLSRSTDEPEQSQQSVLSQFSFPDVVPDSPQGSRSEQFNTPSQVRGLLSPESSRGDSISASVERSDDPIETTPAISLERASEVIDALLNVGYGIEKANENLTAQDNTSILYQLQLIKDIIHRVVLNQRDGNFETIFSVLIPNILTYTHAYINAAVPMERPSGEQGRGLGQGQQTELASQSSMEQGSEGNVAPPTDEEKQEQEKQKEKAALQKAHGAAALTPANADAFKEAEAAISDLTSASETTLFIGYLCKCCEVLCNFVIEKRLVDGSRVNNDQEYQFIRSKVVETSISESPERYDGGAADFSRRTLFDGPGSEFGGNGGSSAKKSTHRKPRRHTRNYQSHNNKRKQHSSKKSTIKHRKSYRKHNRTIKRRSHRK